MGRSIAGVREGVLRAAARDALSTLTDFERWGTLAWTDTSLRYRRTVLGPWWVTLSTAVFIGSVGLVWGGIFGTELSSYMPFFATGYILWSLISSALNEGCNVFILAIGLIKSMTTPLLVHIFRMLGRQFIVFAHNIVIVGLLWAIFRWPIDWSILLVIPGMMVLAVALFGGVLMLGVLCTRFRDVQQIIGAMLQLLFLLTPIMWRADLLAGKRSAVLLDFNPLFYLIQIVRGPLLGAPPSLGVWLGALVSAIVSLTLGLAIYGRFRHRIAYWL
jgi:ABC-type polysaccharide/polyol phosphate export permease